MSRGNTGNERVDDLIEEARAAGLEPLGEPELSTGPALIQFSDEAERRMGHWPRGYFYPVEAEEGIR